MPLWRDSRASFESDYAGSLAGVEGALGALGLTSRADTLLSSLVDEADLLEAAQQEMRDRAEDAAQGRPYKPRMHRPKSRKALEALDEELNTQGGVPRAPFTSGVDFFSQLIKLVKQYEVEMPHVTVEYDGLTVETDALMGSAGIPTVWNTFAQCMQGMVGVKPATTRHTILNNIKGVLVPGRLTLLLAPPGSGKTTLMKTLAGRYQHEKTLHISGDIRYNGHTFDEFRAERTAAFISQHDVHIPALSVLDTLMFAYVCQQGLATKNDYNLLAELRDAITRKRARSAHQHADPSASAAHNLETADTAEGHDPNDPWAGKTPEQVEDEILALGEKVYLSGVKVLTLMRGMGISHTKDTPVGDSMLRGVSGGERKRVTVAEMMVGPRRVGFMDEISTGLDSATLHSIISRLGVQTRGFGMTSLVSLLQPPPEVYALFDDLLLLVEGHVLFHGPVGEAAGFFAHLGFTPPPRKDLPSFLLEAATPAGQLAYASDALLKERGIASRDADLASLPNGGWVVPLAEMAARFWTETDAGRAMQAKLDNRFDRAQSHPAALVTTPYALTPLQALAVVTQRQVLLVLKDPVLIKGRLLQVCVIGLILGGLFYDQSHDLAGARSFFGALFLSVMFMAMGSMPQLAITMTSKPVWYKMRDARFYPGWVHAVATAIAQIPVAAIDTAAWSLVTYFMWGLYRGPGGGSYFFTYYLILLAVNINCGALFRAIAHIAPDGVSANSYGGVALLVLIVMSGFTIVRGSIPDWWIWAYYISPFAWALRAVVINEFTSPGWDTPSPEVPGQTLGETALLTFDFFTERKWIWGGVGFLFGTTLAFTAVSALVLQYTSPKTVARVADEEAIAEARKEAAARRAAQRARDTEMTPVANPAADGKAAAGVPAVSVTVSSGLPFTPVTLVFRELRYFVPNPAEGAGGDGKGAPPARLELLKGITGFAVPGTLTALMGGSGAGKTTLMDCIAGRKTVGEITGDILVNGHPKDQATWSRVVGYCEQMDIHTPAQTVVEALQFSARLRLPSEVDDERVKAYVEEVMDTVDLTPLMYDLVGAPGSGLGLSVEARKRLTIGVELVANPSVVFMDEPTSGLDARAAAIVMRAVRAVAGSGRAVLVTIHQPSIEIFEAFDCLLLLQRGGRTTYFGPLGAQSQCLIDYLTGATQGVEPCPEGANPATWMLEVTGGAVAVGAKAVQADWPELYKDSALCKANAEKADALAARDAAAMAPLSVAGGRYASTFRTQLRALGHKYALAYWRTPSYNLTRYIVTLLTAFLYGTIFYKAADYSYPAGIQQVQSVMGVIYSSTSFLGMSMMMAAMPIVGLERVVYYREQAAATYNPWAFGAVMSLVEMPYILVQCVVFVCIVYPLVHYKSDAAHFFYYLLLTIQSIVFYTSFGMALTYATPSQQLAQVAGAGLNFLFNIFNGFVITYPAMAIGWRWINRASPTTWILYGLGADQLGGDTGAMVAVGFPGVRTVQEFIEQYFGFEYDFRFYCIAIIMAYIVFLRVAAVLALRYINFLKR